MGNIASPAFKASPIEAIKSLWFGEFPEFGTIDEANELIYGLLSGVWNSLAHDQDRNSPFQLTRHPIAITKAALSSLVDLRAGEIEGFIHGLYGENQDILFPVKAQEALMHLVEILDMFIVSSQAIDNNLLSHTQHDLHQFAKNVQKMTLHAENWINKIIQSTKRARTEHGEPMSAQPIANPLDLLVEPPLITSPLSQQITHHGVTVQVDIYGDSDGWILEIIDATGTSQVWEDPFETDAQALAEAIEYLELDTTSNGSDASGNSIH